MAGIEDGSGAHGVFIPDRLITGTLDANGEQIVLPLRGRMGVGFLLVTTDLIANINATVSYGGNFVAAPTVDPVGDPLTLTFAGTAQTVNGTMVVGGGATSARLRLTSYTSGSITATLMATAIGNFNLPVRQRVSTATLTNVAASATSVQLLAANITRRGVRFHNDSSAICYIKYGTTAATTSFTVRLDTQQSYDMPPPIYLGRIDAIWAAAAGDIKITELTP